LNNADDFNNVDTFEASFNIDVDDIIDVGIVVTSFNIKVDDDINDVGIVVDCFNIEVGNIKDVGIVESIDGNELLTSNTLVQF
jgi:hypothetical protein